MNAYEARLAKAEADADAAEQAYRVRSLSVQNEELRVEMVEGAMKLHGRLVEMEQDVFQDEVREPLPWPRLHTPTPTPNPQPQPPTPNSSPNPQPQPTQDTDIEYQLMMEERASVRKSLEGTFGPDHSDASVSFFDLEVISAMAMDEADSLEIERLNIEIETDLQEVNALDERLEELVADVKSIDSFKVSCEPKINI